MRYSARVSASPQATVAGSESNGFFIRFARARSDESARAAGHQPPKFFATKSQFTRFQNDSTYLGRALR